MGANSIDDYGYNLGSFGRKITTTSANAQRWFDRGLIWTYSFHHEEAIRCFERAITEDSSAAMAYWGLAYALGPNYNKPWEMFDENDLKSTLKRIEAANESAKQHCKDKTEIEQALIAAIQTRVPQGADKAAFRACNEAYAAAMGSVYEKFPKDLDVASLYADSLMNLSAWDLWDLRTGEPTPGARSLEAKAVLDHSFTLEGANSHPALLHLYIHLMEMSKTPEAALVAADHLRTLIPEAGHLVHMPSHLDILIGDYRAAIASNTIACLADEKYLAEHGGDNFYTFYRLHNYHTLVYAAMFAGQSKVALEAVTRMEGSLSESFLRTESPPIADWLEFFVAVRTHVLIRFGLWQDILDLALPEDQKLYSVTTAILHYGKGIAYASTNRVPEAESERELLHAACGKVPATRIAGDFVNSSAAVLDVAKAMLDGEIEYRKRNYEVAFQHLQVAMERDDALHYAEPWPWMQPTRHAYAALKMEQGDIEEAAKAYAADLGYNDTLPRARQHPNNVWALHGYHECLVKLGKTAEAGIVGQQLRVAQAVADVKVKASCYCRGVAGAGAEESGGASELKPELFELRGK